jgi:hypothetical protein
LLAGQTGALRGRAALALFGRVVRDAADRSAVGDLAADSRPALRLPTYRQLAVELGFADKGSSADALRDAAHAIAALSIETPTGGSLRYWMLEHEPHAPGRLGAVIVTPGEVLWPTFASRQPKNAPDWRRVVPYPDVDAPTAWTAAARQHADAVRLGLLAAVAWRSAAGREHGARWLERPGLANPVRELERRANQYGIGLDVTAAIKAWEGTGWAHVEAGQLVPGEALPRLSAALVGSAEGAATKVPRSPRRRKPG